MGISRAVVFCFYLKKMKFESTYKAVFIVWRHVQRSNSLIKLSGNKSSFFLHLQQRRQQKRTTAVSYRQKKSLKERTTMLLQMCGYICAEARSRRKKFLRHCRKKLEDVVVSYRQKKSLRDEPPDEADGIRAQSQMSKISLVIS